MNYKRIIYALLYSEGYFHLSRNFNLQKVGDVNWLKNNFGFGSTCDFIDELMIILVSKNPNKEEVKDYFKKVNLLRERIFVPITLGGGIRSLDDSKKYFENGADKILINYLAHNNKNEINKISNLFGRQAVSLMVDLKKNNLSYKSYINSGKEESLDLKDYFGTIKDCQYGEIILNSIDMDGTASGFDINLINEIPNNFKNPLLIMGGAGKPNHFSNLLKNDKISGVVTANLFNFLGSGLEICRNYCINNDILLNKF